MAVNMHFLDLSLKKGFLATPAMLVSSNQYRGETRSLYNRLAS